MSITTLLTDPDSYLAPRAENPGLLRPLGVVVLAAIAAVLAPLVTYQAFVSAGATPLATLGQAASVIVAFFGQFVAWVVFTLVFYLLSIGVNGEGSLGDTFELNGWGFVPAIIAGIVAAIGRLIALQSVSVPDLPQNVNQDNAQVFVDALAEFQNAIQSQPVVRIATLIVIALTLWQAYIWIHATKHARDLSLRGATIAVGIPVGIFVLYSLYTLLTGWVL